MDHILKLELSVAEVNAILNALAQRPYAEVANLFAKVQQQAQGQLPPPEAPEAPETPESPQVE